MPSKLGAAATTRQVSRKASLSVRDRSPTDSVGEFSRVSLSRARASAADASGAGSATTGAALLSRHDLILEEDLPRVLEAYFAVDEHRRMTVTVAEAEEVFRVVNVRGDSAALMRAPTVSSEDDAHVKHLRRTSLSSQLALQGCLRDAIGCPFDVTLRSLASCSGGSAAAAAPCATSTAAPTATRQRSLSRIIRRSSTSTTSAFRQISFLGLMRMFFPSYPRKSVEKAVIAMLPAAPVFPDPPPLEQYRLLFRSCKSSVGKMEDTDVGSISYAQLVQHCKGIDRTQLGELCLQHCQQMSQYALQDLESFEDFRIYDLLRRADLPAGVFQNHRFTPPLSMLNLMQCWELLRPQLMEPLSIAQQTRLSQLVVFMLRHGAPAAFRVQWPPIASSSLDDKSLAATDTPACNAHIEASCGVDGLQRAPIDLDDVQLTIDQLARALAMPSTPPVALEPFLSSSTVAALSELRRQALQLPSAAASRGAKEGDDRPNLRLAKPGLCRTSASQALQASAYDGVETSFKARREGCASGFSLGDVGDEPTQILAAVQVGDAGQPLLSDSDSQHRGSSTLSSPRQQQHFPAQAVVRLQRSARCRKDLTAVIEAKCQVDFRRQVAALGVCAVYEISQTSGSTDSVVLTPRSGGVLSPRSVEPLNAYQRHCTPALQNYGGNTLLPPHRPHSARHQASPVVRSSSTAGNAVVVQPGAGVYEGHRSLLHAVSRPLGFTGVVLPPNALAGA